MIDILHKLGLPINMSVQGAAIDEINAIIHWLMLVLFVGWGLFFIVSLVKFRASKNAKADYTGVKSHLSSLLEAVVAVVEIVILFGFAFPIWANRVIDVPPSDESVHLRVVAQQFAWNVHYPGPDGKFGFGGSCFPKDIQAMIHFAQTLDIHPSVLIGAWETNLDVRPEQDWKELKGRAVVEEKA